MTNASEIILRMKRGKIVNHYTGAQNNRFRSEKKKAIARLKQWGADVNDKFAIPED